MTSRRVETAGEAIARLTRDVADLRSVLTTRAPTAHHAATHAAGGSDEIADLYELVVFTSSGTFSKAGYTWAKRYRATVIGGGGGGGGAAVTSTSEVSGGGGGGAGGYATKAGLVSGLGASVTVTVGAGGTGGVGGAVGSSGATSSFGTVAVAGGGGGGGHQAATGTVPRQQIGATGGAATAGDLQVTGQPGTPALLSGFLVGQVVGGSGGSGPWGGGARGATAGVAGTAPGGGGSGAANRQNQASAVDGGAGGAGRVLVELYG